MAKSISTAVSCLGPGPPPYRPPLARTLVMNQDNHGSCLRPLPMKSCPGPALLLAGPSEK